MDLPDGEFYDLEDEVRALVRAALNAANVNFRSPDEARRYTEALRDRVRSAVTRWIVDLQVHQDFE